MSTSMEDLAREKFGLQEADADSKADLPAGESHYTRYYEAVQQGRLDRKKVEEITSLKRECDHLREVTPLASALLFVGGSLGFAAHCRYASNNDAGLILWLSGGLYVLTGTALAFSRIKGSRKLKQFAQENPHEYRRGVSGTWGNWKTKKFAWKNLRRVDFLENPENFTVVRPYNLKHAGWRYSYLTQLRDAYADKLRRLNKVDSPGMLLPARSVRKADKLKLESQRVLQATEAEYAQLEKIMTFESLGGLPEKYEERRKAGEGR